MTLGLRKNDEYRAHTHEREPVRVQARVRCDECKSIKSIGQFPADSRVCITCKPQGKNFRRGGL